MVDILYRACTANMGRGGKTLYKNGGIELWCVADAEGYGVSQVNRSLDFWENSCDIDLLKIIVMQ